MEVLEFMTDPEGNIRMGKGVLSEWRNIGGRHYNVVVLEGDDGHKVEYGFPDLPYENGRIIRPDEKYAPLDYKPGLSFYHSKGEKDASLLTLWRADGCDKIVAGKYGADILASYSGKSFTIALAILEEGGSLKAYPRKVEGENCQDGAFLLLNDGGKLFPYKGVSLFKGI